MANKKKINEAQKEEKNTNKNLTWDSPYKSSSKNGFQEYTESDYGKIVDSVTHIILDDAELVRTELVIQIIHKDRNMLGKISLT